MMRLTRARFLSIAACALVAGAQGCTIHVETPQLAPRSMEFTGIDGAGLNLRVTFAAYNSNTFSLDLSDLEARLIIEGNDVGTSVTAVPFQLPPGRWVDVTANVRIPWNGAPASLLATASQPMVTYVLQGEVTVSHYLSVRAHFETQGTTPREFFMRGAAGAVNSVINSVLPGFGGVQVGP